MICLESLKVSPGVTSVVGSGGKTSLLCALAEELVGKGESVVLATTTHFLPFEGIPLVTSADMADVAQALDERGIVCVGSWARGAVAQAAALRAQEGTAAKTCKLGPSPIPIEELAKLARYVLVEADGSRRLPLKAHAPHEPVVPACSQAQVLVVGASGLMRPIAEVAHRPELFCELSGCAPGEPATPGRVARAIAREVEAGALAPTHIIVNQAEPPRILEPACRLAHELAVQLHELGSTPAILIGTIRGHSLHALN